MLMLSSRHLGPMRMFFFDKWKEIRRDKKFLKIFKIFGFCQNCDAFFGQYTTAMSALNVWKRQIVNNLTHNLRHFL